jgi:hypothetical protein
MNDIQRMVLQYFRLYVGDGAASRTGKQFLSIPKVPPFTNHHL